MPKLTLAEAELLRPGTGHYKSRRHRDEAQRRILALADAYDGNAAAIARDHPELGSPHQIVLALRTPPAGWRGKPNPRMHRASCAQARKALAIHQLRQRYPDDSQRALGTRRRIAVPAQRVGHYLKQSRRHWAKRERETRPPWWGPPELPGTTAPARIAKWRSPLRTGKALE